MGYFGNYLGEEKVTYGWNENENDNGEINEKEAQWSKFKRIFKDLFTFQCQKLTCLFILFEIIIIIIISVAVMDVFI